MTVDFTRHQAIAGAQDAAGARVFQRQKSAAGWIIAALIALPATLLLVVSLLNLPLWGDKGDHGVAALAGTVSAILFAMAWLVRRSYGSGPVLVLTPQGMSGQAFKRMLLWDEIDDALTLHNGTVLSLALRPGVDYPAPGLFGMGKGQVNVSLQPLSAGDRQAAVLAVGEAVAAGRASRGLGLPQSAIDAAQQAHFQQQLVQLTPLTWGLYAVVGINVAVWLANLFAGMSWSKPASAELFAWGANSAWAVTHDHEYWRLLTATFLHGGLMHLALNMFGLWEAGRYLCRLLGNGQFLLLYFGSALAGSALSLHFSSQIAVSVGASGAVFGVLGGLVASMAQHRGGIPKAARNSILTSQTVFVLYALMQGFAQKGVDNAAHVGGLLTGAAMAWLLVEKIDGSASAARRRLGLGLAVAMAAGAVLALIYTAPLPAVNHRSLFATQAAVDRLLPQIRAASDALSKDGAAAQAGAMTDAQLVEAMEQRHIPAVQAIVAALAPLDASAANPGGEWVKNARAYHQLLLEGMQLETARARGTKTGPEIEARLVAVHAELKAVAQRMSQQAQAQKQAASQPK